MVTGTLQRASMQKDQGVLGHVCTAHAATHTMNVLLTLPVAGMQVLHEIC